MAYMEAAQHPIICLVDVHMPQPAYSSRRKAACMFWGLHPISSMFWRPCSQCTLFSHGHPPFFSSLPCLHLGPHWLVPPCSWYSLLTRPAPCVL